MQTRTPTPATTLREPKSADAATARRPFQKIEVLDLQPSGEQSIVPIMRVNEVWKGVPYSALND